MADDFNVVVSFVLALTMGLFALGLFSNLKRASFSYDFQLKPNCLLTRHPVVFLTGPRSIFYFRKYWNAFPVYLAEHGYEVFTVHLPWKGPLRKQKLSEFLHEQARQRKRFHFILDRASALELSEILNNSDVVLSQSIPPQNLPTMMSAQQGPTAKSPLGLLSLLSFYFHRRIRYRHFTSAPSLVELGASFPAGTDWLLPRMQDLGEQDYLRS